MAKKTINVIYKVDDKELEEAKKTISGVEKEAKDADKAVKGLGNTAKESGAKASAGMSNFQKTIAAVSLVALAKQVFDFGLKVANITAEFQKFEAVLTNTLGSRSQAQLALGRIKSFAASTPFSVQELTASFVKLANQGFKPTLAEMTKLGDLASANGKSFDQLTEAIIDAQTGEFERLKEFGIRASKEGDNVTFAFKGVETQTKFNSKAIREYILGLGELSGVQGGMSAISETLGGKISNLGDAWDSFLTTVGSGNEGILSGTVSLLSKAVEKATELIKEDSQRASDTATAVYETFKGLETEAEQVEFLNKLYKRQFDLSIIKAKADKDALNTLSESRRAYSETISKEAKQDLEVIKNILGFIQGEKEAAISDAEKQKLAEEATANKIKRQADEQARLNREKEKTNKLKEIERYAEGLDKDSPQEDFRDPFFVLYGDKIEADSKRILDAIKETDSNIVSQQEDRNAKLLEKERIHQDQMTQVRQFAFDQALNLIGQLLLAEDNRVQRAIEGEKFFAEQQTLLAGDNERRKAEIKIESDRRIEDLQKQQAEREKNQIIKRILIESALNAVKALGTPPVPNFLLAGITAAFGVAQAGIVRSQGFADGVIDLKGAGTTKSDSIPARLSRGESVITAEATASSRNLLEAIQDRKIDDSILSKMAKGGGAQVNVFDDSRLIKAIEKNKVNVSREAYTLYETRQMGKNLRVKVRSKIQGY
jgi:hypothetical protein